MTADLKYSVSASPTSWQFKKILSLSVLGTLFLASMPACCYAATQRFTCDFFVNNGSIWNPWERHTLCVSVTQSLHEYYQGKDHSCYPIVSSYPKFVTPDSMTPVAERVWSVCQNEARSEEQFVNAILMFSHQIPYVAGSDVKYPVETIVDQSGDCDLFSLLTASVLKARNLDVILLYWDGNPPHMNLGVYLSNPPVYCSQPSWYLQYSNKTYYIAECTWNNLYGQPLYEGWKVGECPDDYRNVAPEYVITLQNCELSSPSQISASVDSNLSPSSLASSCSYQSPLHIGEQVQIQGTITPNHSGKSVVLYCRKGVASWGMMQTTTTDYSNTFFFTVSFDSAGMYHLRASWSGDADHEGADSTTFTLNVSLAVSYTFLALSSSTVHLGETITITGYLLPAHSYQSVILHYHQEGYEWNPLVTVSTDSVGDFSYQWIPSAVGTFYLRAEWVGDSDHQGSVSDINMIAVSKAFSSLTLATSSSSINMGETATLSGAIFPAHGNVNLEIYSSSGNYQWSLLTSVSTDMQGQYVYYWSPLSSGTYYLKAGWSGDADHLGADSSIFELTVTYSPPTNPDDHGTPDNQNSGTSVPNHVLEALTIVGISVVATGICLIIIVRRRHTQTRFLR